MMENFSNAECADIHFVYGLANGNARLASRLYANRFPHRRHPNYKCFISIHNRLRENGKFEKDMSAAGRPRTVCLVDFEEDILHQVEENPSISTRAIANNMNASKSTVWNVLHRNLLHPFKLQKVQALKAEDYLKRVECARWFLRQDIESPNFIKNVLFTDESSFTREGIFNLRNNHVWAQLNPNAIVQRGHQVRFSINVWVGILNDTLLGPYILPNRLSAQSYIVFLRDVLPDLLQDVPLQQRLDLWFQHDGAPAHFANDVREHLNLVFREKWIGRGGPIPWPPRSPDLTPVDFSIWGQMKQLVYSTPVVDEMDLVARIVEAGAQIQEKNTFQDIRRSSMRRFRLCNEEGGRHFEHLL